MKQKMKRMLAYVLSCCLAIGIVQLSAVTGRAADGAIDTSVEGVQKLTYYTGDAGTVFSAPVNQNEHLTDFFAGTNTMTWSLEFKTTGTGLQSLLALEDSGNYWSFFVKNNNTIGFEAKSGSSVTGTVSAYNDDQWHKAVLTVTKKQGITLSMDGVVKASSTNAPVCIEDLPWTPTAFTVGGMTAYSSASGWKFSGSIRNVELTKTVPVAVGEPVVEVVKPEKGGKVSGSASPLTTGSVHTTYRLEEETSGKVTLLGLGEDSEIYLNADSNKVGIRSGDSTFEATVENTELGTTKWHNLTVNVDGRQAEICVDGVSAQSGGFAGNLDVSTISFSNDAYFSQVNVYDNVLKESQMESLHEATASDSYPDMNEKTEGYVKGPNMALFNAGYDGSASYRIPAIITSKKTGTVIASIDKRWNGSGDIGQIDTVIRRSEDNGRTWDDLITVIDLKDPYGYTVDPAMLVDNNEDSPHYGRIYILADMFMRETGFAGAQAGTGFTDVDGKAYQTLTGKTDGSQYTVRENGIVYDSQNQKTDYQVELESAPPFKTQGDLYRNGEYVGNIYNRNNELAIFDTTYLWLTYSDDDGFTWSAPKNITPMVKSEWMKFCGAGPGIGICTQNGRLIFPVYCTNSAGKQSSFNIYSEDDGETWHAGGSPNNGGDMENATSELTESCIAELDNGHLIQFMRSYNGAVTTSVSSDQGMTWAATVKHTGIRDPYCQMSAVHYPGKIHDPKDGQDKEAIIFSNPNATNRSNGTVRIAFVNADDTLTWAYGKVIEPNRYNYSSVTVMNNGEIGVFYEHEKGSQTSAAFTYLSTEYLMDTNPLDTAATDVNPIENTPVPTGITVSAADSLAAGDEIRIQVSFDQNVFAAGNVTLNLDVGDQKREAVLVGNVDADTLAFAYTFTESDDGAVVAKAEINVKEGGAAENIYNVSLLDNPYVNKEVTVGRISALKGMDELPVAGMTATTGSAAADGVAGNVLDGSSGTVWHSRYPDDNASADPANRAKHWITIDLGGKRLVSGLTYLPRQTGTNGIITEYQIEVSTNGTDFVPVAVGSWKKNADMKAAYLEGPVVATHVMLRAIESNDDFASAAEIRIIGSTDTALYVDRTEALQALTKASIYGEEIGQIAGAEGLEETLKAARAVVKDVKADASAVKKASEDIDRILNAIADKVKEELPKEIERAGEKKQENYNLSSWAAHKEALNAARSLESDAAQQEIILAYLNLVAAEKNLYLNETGNKAMIEEIKKEAKKAKDVALETLAQGEEKFTEESLNSYKKVYDRLVSALERGADGNTLNALMDELTVAAKNLKKKEKDPGEDPGKDPGEDPSKDPGKNPGTDPDKTPTPVLPDSPVKPTPAQGKVYSVGNLKYKVTNLAKKTVELAGAVDKAKVTKLKVPKTVKILGVSFKVTSVGAKAFAKCKKLKSVSIGANVTKIGKQAFNGCGSLKKIKFSTKALKSVGAKAFKGINKKAVIRVPKAKKAAYTKLLKKKGQPTSVKIR